MKILPTDFLHELGILGINRRNAELILQLNSRSRYPEVDDKILTKHICSKHNIPVPATYGIIERWGDINTLNNIICYKPGFVIKPSRGCGGRGVVIGTSGNSSGKFTVAGRPDMRLPELHYHISGILAGLFSIGGRPDRAIVEERIEMHPVLFNVCPAGTPDIRIIVYRGIPVMAMIRLPTEGSRGRANLHQGAAGAGIDIKTGLTSGAVWNNRIIETHPDSGALLKNLAIPFWNDLVSMSVKTAQTLQMGYIGVDLIIDGNRGPLVLEVNARPGLSIQIANRRGLLACLEKADKTYGNQP